MKRNTTKNIYVCIGAHEQEKSYENSFFLLPIGVCDQFYPKSDIFKLESYIKNHGYIYESWPYTYDSEYLPIQN